MNEQNGMRLYKVIEVINPEMIGIDYLIETNDEIVIVGFSNSEINRELYLGSWGTDICQDTDIIVTRDSWESLFTANINAGDVIEKLFDNREAL